MNDNNTNMLNFLKDACKQINSFEATAKQVLAEGDSTKYYEIMLKKAKFIATMPLKADQILSMLTPSLKELIAPELQNFSASALNAISVNSPFYMSALLFPDDYVAGNLNNLEIFTSKIEDILNDQ